MAARGSTPPPIYNTNDRVNPSLRPYLTLPYLLSLTWLAYPILSLIFIVFRLQISSASAQDAVNDAKDNLLVSCKAAQQAATAAASLPRFMAIGTNKQFADGINDTLNGSREALILVLTCMESIINFIIDIYRSTFLCFLELAIRGGLAILIAAVQDIENFVQGSLGFIRTSIQSDISSFNSLIQSTVNGLNKIIPFGNPVTAPQITIPSLDALQNVTLPTTIQDALTQLNASIPSLDQLRTTIQGFVDTPFELVKADINNTFANLSFDASILPVPAENTLSFCDNLDTSIVDNLGKDLLKIARIGTGILLIIVLLMLLGNCAVEWYKWRSLKKNLQRTRLAWINDPTVHSVQTGSIGGSVPTIQMTDHNLLTLHFDSLHPLLSRFANYLSGKFRLSPTQYTNLRFFFHYVFHPPALACFLIGFFGLLSVELQLLAVHPLEAKFSSQAAAQVTDFTNLIASNVNDSMYNQSSFYANGINTQVTLIQNTVNDGVFGWVNSTTTTLNDTINTFYSDVQNVVNTVFGGTPLQQPAQDFIACIIGSKVAAFENALTFLHDNLHVNLPTVNESVLILSPSEVSKVSQPISAAAVGGGNGQDQGGLVGKLVARYVESLNAERFMFAVFLGLWFVVVLMALSIIAWHSIRNRRRTPTEEADEWPSKAGGDLPSFTPTIDAQPVGYSGGGFWDAFKHNNNNNNVSNNEKHDQRKTIDSFIMKSDKRMSNKLRQTGRKAMGREILQDDNDRSSVSGSGWISRMKGGRSSSSLVTPFELPPPPEHRSTRPKLTISTSEREENNNNNNSNVPGSAWSVSPHPETPARRVLPWRHHSNTPSFVNLSRPRHTPDTPMGPISPPMPLSPMFITPRGGLVPQRQQRANSFTPISPSGTMTPVTFLLNTSAGGSGGGYIPPVPVNPFDDQIPRNPFMTPFDDENVPMSPTPQAV